MKKTLELYQNLNSCYQSLLECSTLDKEKSIKESISCINCCKASVVSYETFIEELSKYQYTFPDIIRPLLNNVTEFLYGLKLKIELVSNITNQCMVSSDLQNIVTSFIKIPTLSSELCSYTNYITSYTNENFQCLLFKLLRNENKSHIVDKEIFR